MATASVRPADLEEEPVTVSAASQVSSSREIALATSSRAVDPTCSQVDESDEFSVAGACALAAHRRHVAGEGWPEIARHEGYISPQVAQMAVTAYLQRAAVAESVELRTAALHTELDRLDAMHAAFWAKALDGDGAAATTILKIMDRRNRLLGLDRLEDPFSSSRRTIVVGAGNDMASQLKDIALSQCD